MRARFGQGRSHSGGTSARIFSLRYCQAPACSISTLVVSVPLEFKEFKGSDPNGTYLSDSSV